MKKRWMIFWMLYALFFAVPFPMILYYSINNEKDIGSLQNQSPWFALTLVALSIVLWLIVLTGFLRKWVLKVLSAKNNIEKLKKEGVTREAKIITSTKLSKPGGGYDTYELQLSFKNLSGTEIKQRAKVNDIKPYERRFEVGKTLELKIDKDLIHIPYFVFSSSEVQVKKTFVVLSALGWLLVVVLVAGYYVFSYQHESYGMGWRFMSIGHPLLVCPAVFLFYRGLSALILNFNMEFRESIRLKFKGKRATANIISVRQTGVFINEQP
ncbi:hypothetical protein, partial [Pedobacter sp. HMWF019]|uniref:hypothetical protein n=1 Tax=Pedobacter sp. HMWF019 TaxID=2056856 RepID=UPI0018EEAA5E